MGSDFEDVGAFHEKFGLERSGGRRPHTVEDDVALFRLKFLLEELQEIAEGYGYILEGGNSALLSFRPVRQSHNSRQDLAKVADGLIDLVYVALGTAHLHSLPWAKLWDEVQRANMSKERAAHSDDNRSTRKHSLDVVKPVGFKPPAIIETLMSEGWPGPELPL